MPKSKPLFRPYYLLIYNWRDRKIGSFTPSPIFASESSPFLGSVSSYESHIIVLFTTYPHFISFPNFKGFIPSFRIGLTTILFHMTHIFLSAYLNQEGLNPPTCQQKLGFHSTVRLLYYINYTQIPPWFIALGSSYYISYTPSDIGTFDQLSATQNNNHSDPLSDSRFIPWYDNDNKLYIFVPFL